MAPGLEPEGIGFCPSSVNEGQEPTLPSDAVSSTDGQYLPYDPDCDHGLCDELDLLRPPPGWMPDDLPVNYRMICEDEEPFWQMVSDGSFTVRKTTNRKGNKLQTMCNVLESEDLSRTRKLHGRNLTFLEHLLLERLGSSSCWPARWA